LKGKILIAEDHDSIAETYKLILEAQDYEVTVTKNGQECIETFDQHMSSKENSDSGCYKLVILDYHLPIRDAIDVSKHIFSKCPDQRILIASSYPAEVIRKSAENLVNEVELLIKPFDLEYLVEAIAGRKAVETIGSGHGENRQVKRNDGIQVDDLQVNR
jgi:two-component system cell cycle response regulator CpdR